MIQSLDLLEQTTAVSKLRRLLSLGKAYVRVVPWRRAADKAQID